MEIKNPEEVEFSEMILTIILGADDFESFVEKICLNEGEFTTLKDIKDDYPSVEMVIAESALSGKVYRYGNHGEFWEEVGETRGYA